MITNQRVVILFPKKMMYQTKVKIDRDLKYNIRKVKLMQTTHLMLNLIIPLTFQRKTLLITNNQIMLGK